MEQSIPHKPMANYQPIFIPNGCHQIIVARRYTTDGLEIFFKFMLVHGASSTQTIKLQNTEHAKAIQDQLDDWVLVKDTDELKVYER